jgi:enoyl-CoA hydratase/carnithine racemase
LVRLLGRPKAIRYLYEGRLPEAPQALDWGLVDEVVKSDDLQPHVQHYVQHYAEDLATKPAGALAAITKSAVSASAVAVSNSSIIPSSKPIPPPNVIVRRGRGCVSKQTGSSMGIEIAS